MRHNPSKVPDYKEIELMVMNGASAKDLANYHEVHLNTHYRWLKDDKKYAKAYAKGLNHRRRELFNNMNRIATDERDKTQGAAIEATKYLMDRSDKDMYLIAQPDLEADTPEERLLKLEKAIADDLIHPERATRLLNVIKAQIKGDDEAANVTVNVPLYELPNNGKRKGDGGGD